MSAPICDTIIHLVDAIAMHETAMACIRCGGETAMCGLTWCPLCRRLHICPVADVVCYLFGWPPSDRRNCIFSAIPHLGTFCVLVCAAGQLQHKSQPQQPECVFPVAWWDPQFKLQTLSSLAQHNPKPISGIRSMKRHLLLFTLEMSSFFCSFPFISISRANLINICSRPHGWLGTSESSLICWLLSSSERMAELWRSSSDWEINFTKKHKTFPPEVSRLAAIQSKICD